MTLTSKKIQEMQDKGNSFKNSRKAKKNSKIDRRQKIIEYHIKIQSDLKELSQRLKKYYKLHRSSFYEISEFRDYIMCLFMSNDKARYFYDFIQGIKKKIKLVPSKRDLEEIEASEDSNKALTKKESNRPRRPNPSQSAQVGEQEEEAGFVQRVLGLVVQQHHHGRRHVPHRARALLQRRLQEPGPLRRV